MIQPPESSTELGGGGSIHQVVSLVGRGACVSLSGEGHGNKEVYTIQSTV